MVLHDVLSEGVITGQLFFMRAHLRFQKLYLRAYDPHPTIHNVTDSQNLNKIACMSGPWLIVVDCSISLSMLDKGQWGQKIYGFAIEFLYSWSFTKYF